jgi:hypothetical protein
MITVQDKIKCLNYLIKEYPDKKFLNELLERYKNVK